MNLPDEIHAWLDKIGLGVLAPVFAGHHITPENLVTLTDGDLMSMGIDSIGHRKTLLAAIAKIQVGTMPDPVEEVRKASPQPYVIPQTTLALPPPRLAKAPPRAGFSARSRARAPRPLVQAPVNRILRPAVSAPVVDAPEPAYEEPETPAYHQPPSGPASKRKLFSGSFLVISIIVHAVLGLGAGYLVVESIAAKRKLQFAEGPPTANPSKRALEHQVSMQKKKNSGGAPAQAKRIAVTGVASKITLPEMPAMPNASTQFVAGRMAGMGGAGFGSGLGFGNGTGMGVGGGIGTGGLGLNLPPSMKSRCSPIERLRKLIENGGSPECEKAVSNALDYLKTKQNANGSWGTANRAAMTGFALLCYFGHCETPDSPLYGDNVMKGILYLVELSKSNAYGMISENPKVNHATYEHGIATYALGEMYSLARLGNKSLPGVKEAFENGVKLIIDNQAASGGWGYGGGGETAYNKGGNDLSVTGWQYQALKAAKLTGLKIDHLHEAISKVVQNIEKLQTKDGGFGNTGTGAYNQWSLSGVGILGLQTFATNKSALIKKGIKFSYNFQKKEPPTWESATAAGHARPSLYGWYYYAQSYFQNGGSEMKFWNETALPEILKHQNKDGSWTGSGAILTAGGDNIFTTALCTLMLEVYYRYLKV